jgi:RNA polymerase sigma-70 factor (ECF subfamily)
MSDSKSPRVEELLAATAWVRRLAQRLVRDEAAVDDIVQEAHVAALEARPSGDLRAWLGAVVRKLASRRLRGESARTYHERSAATRDDRDASELAHDEASWTVRVELQRELADAILVLPEPDRRAVIARYLEDLPYAALAGRLGVTEAAARKRVSRGLARLRRCLSQRAHGLLFAAVFEGWLHPAPTSLALGGTTMGLKTVSAAALAAFAVTAGVLYWSAGRASEPRPGRESVAPATAAVKRPLPGATAERPAAVEAPARRIVDSTATAQPVDLLATVDRERDLHGRVLDADGAPIEAALVELRRSPLREYRAHAPDELRAGPMGTFAAETETDATGAFAVPLSPGRPFDLWVSAVGFGSAVLPDRYAGELVEVRLRAPATLTGRVTRASDGSAVAGARLFGWRDDTSHFLVFEGETGVDGRYRFEGLEPVSIRIRVVAPDLASPYDVVAVGLTSGEERRRDFALHAGQRILGRVVDAETGAPVIGARAGLGWSLRKATRSDEDGQFELRGVSRDGAFDVHVLAAGYGRAVVPVVFGDGSSGRADVALERGYRARGRVVDGHGRPVPGARIAAATRLATRFDADRITCASSTDGDFVLTDLRAGASYHLLVVKEGFGAAVVACPPVGGAGAVELGAVVLQVGGAVAGRVVDTAGAGVPGCKLRLLSRDDPVLVGLARDERDRWVDDAVYLNQRVGRTDDLGRFRFADLPAGDYEILASRYRIGALTVTDEFDGANRVEVRVRPGETTSDVRLPMDLGETIAGSVANEAGEPVAGMMVWLSPLDAGLDEDTNQVTGPLGRFEFIGLRRGWYRLQVFATEIGSGETPPYQEVDLGEVLSGEDDIEVVLAAAAMTSGTVRTVDGSPASKASVLALDASGTELERAFTAADGSFALNLPPGVQVDLLARPAPRDGPFWDPNHWPAPEHGTRVRSVAAGARELQIELPD